MASSSSLSAEKYPCPSDLNAAAFINVRLSPVNYDLWRNLMKSFIKQHELLGFLNGKVPSPPKMITVPDDTSANGTKEIKNPDYLAWKKSDRLLKIWIHSTLTEEVLFQTVNKKTANEVWELLEGLFAYKEDDNESSEFISQDFSKYRELHEAAISGDWHSAFKFLEKEPQAFGAAITGLGETALLLVVKSEQSNYFVHKLVKKMTPEDLALADASGATALHIAAWVGNMKAAKLLVNKSPELSNKRDINNEPPIHGAARYGKRKMFLYLLNQISPVSVPNPLEDNLSARLLHDLIASGQFDIALYLLKRYPDLVYHLAFVEPSPLMSLARMPSAFRHGTGLNTWQRFIYSWVPANLENNESQRKVDKMWDTIFWKVAQIFASHIKDIQDKKLKHHQALQLVKLLCGEIVKLEYSKASSLLEQPLIDAILIGIPEVVEEIVSSFPVAKYFTAEEAMDVLRIAIVSRREDVFNFFDRYDLQEILSVRDVKGNNGLHLAGAFENQQKINLRAQAPSAALQLQRELQWFKDVENFTLLETKEQTNNDRKTPRMLFTEAHQELVKEGEKWMRDTANSCTIVGALIATVVFAAAITVPGGNNERGLPNFADNKIFAIFAISDALALFTSTSSVLMFLSILTSRYEEEDFLYALPKRLILGLVSLFLSIISMMVAFTTTIYLVFGYKRAGILSIVIALACLPVTLFVFLQFSLLLDIIKSTYGPRIFGKQSKYPILFLAKPKGPAMLSARASQLYHHPLYYRNI